MEHPLMKRRILLDLHRTELAVELGCTVETITEWEKGLCKPTPKQLRKWERALGTAWKKKLPDTEGT